MGSVHGRSPSHPPSIICREPSDLGYITSFFVSYAVWKWVPLLPALLAMGDSEEVLREVFRANKLLLPRDGSMRPPQGQYLLSHSCPPHSPLSI